MELNAKKDAFYCVRMIHLVLQFSWQPPCYRPLPSFSRLAYFNQQVTCLNMQPFGAQSSMGTFLQLVIGMYLDTVCVRTVHLFLRLRLLVSNVQQKMRCLFLTGVDMGVGDVFFLLKYQKNKRQKKPGIYYIIT